MCVTQLGSNEEDVDQFAMFLDSDFRVDFCIDSLANFRYLYASFR